MYCGLITELDAQIGRLIEFLKVSGQLDNTLVIVTSDHGELLGDHYMWGKEAVYDPAFHVPLIIRDPRRRATAGSVVDRLTESIDSGSDNCRVGGSAGFRRVRWSVTRSVAGRTRTVGVADARFL